MPDTTPSTATNTATRRFLRFSLLTIAAVVVLVFVGGIVRMTGSGMGCPDWPRCFGQWVPPTDISQLPEDYKTRFAVQGREIATFDAFKTWVEYVNRLVGALIGLLVIGTFFYSLPYRKTDRRIFWLSLASVIGVMFEGWLGSKVVATDLHPGMITIHMVVAMLLLLALVIGYLLALAPSLSLRATPATPMARRNALLITGVATVLTLVQVILGTQVRENVDAVALLFGEDQRDQWIGALGGWYGLHRTFYYVVAASVGAIAVVFRDFMARWREVSFLVWGMVILLVCEIVLGMVMHYMAIPPVAQPLHLLLATLLFIAECALFGILFVLLPAEKLPPRPDTAQRP